MCFQHILHRLSETTLTRSEKFFNLTCGELGFQTTECPRTSDLDETEHNKRKIKMKLTAKLSGSWSQLSESYPTASSSLRISSPK